MKQTESNRTDARDFLYDVCYRKKSGEDKVISEGVSIKKGLKEVRKFKRLMECGSPIFGEILYVFLKPLM